MAMFPKNARDGGYEDYKVQQAALGLYAAINSRDSFPPRRHTLNFNSQKASRVRFSGVSAKAQWFPVCPALVIMSFLCSQPSRKGPLRDYAFQNTVRGGGGVLRLKFALDGLDPGRCCPSSDLVGCIESPATS